MSPIKRMARGFVALGFAAVIALVTADVMLASIVFIDWVVTDDIRSSAAMVFIALGLATMLAWFLGGEYK